MPLIRDGEDDTLDLGIVQHARQIRARRDAKPALESRALFLCAAETGNDFQRLRLAGCPGQHFCPAAEAYDSDIDAIGKHEDSTSGIVIAYARNEITTQTNQVAG